MQDWDEHIRKVMLDRRRIGDALKAVLEGVGSDVAPVAISLAISDAERSVEALGIIKGHDGEVFYSSRVLSSILGGTPTEFIEEWAASGEKGFPPPARGDGPKDWLWSAGELELWLDDRNRSRNNLGG